MSITTHSAMYLVVLTAYIIFSYKFTTFNYKQVWLWNLISLCGVSWLAFLALMDRITSEHTAYVVLMFVGWVLLAVAGVLIQKYKKYPS
jgi:hypothetical protein